MPDDPRVEAAAKALWGEFCLTKDDADELLERAADALAAADEAVPMGPRQNAVSDLEAGSERQSYWLLRALQAEAAVRELTEALRSVFNALDAEFVIAYQAEKDRAREVLAKYEAKP